jgi:SAM-dependent methyltransferase
MAGPARTSSYDTYAEEYAAYVTTREQHGPNDDPFGMLRHLLELLGDVTDLDVLDAGCGEGYLSRILAGRGARVTGVDLSPRLVELSQAKPSPGQIAYRVADLSEPQPDLAGRFDAVASYFVLNDVDDYRGFARTLARALKSGGRAVLGFNNPYDYVVRKGLGSAYFESGKEYPLGLSVSGVPVKFFHRTLPDYLDAFLDAGLYVTKIVDVDHPRTAALRASGEDLPVGEQLPRFMVLAFAKP